VQFIFLFVEFKLTKMQKYSTYKRLIRHRSSVLFLLFTSLLFSSCKEQPQYWREISKEQTAAEFIVGNPDQYSEFAQLMEITDLTKKLNLNVNVSYTILLPTNEAMFAYYKEKKVNSFLDFSEDFRRQLLLNHVFTREENTNSILVGAFHWTNAIDDYISTELRGTDIYLNKSAKIIRRDIPVHNGIIHVIDRVLDPLVKDIYTVLEEDPAYQIFTEGLRLTGIKDTLQLNSIPFGSCTARTRYTIFAVPDTIYNRCGIMNVNDLIRKYGGNPDQPNSKDDPFYRYIEYHCISGTNYLNVLLTKNYPVLSAENNISMTIDNEDYKINLDATTNKYTGFIIPSCNISAKNGAIHTVNNLLPVFIPKPEFLSFETTEYPDLEQQSYYRTDYMQWFDGEDPFAKIKFHGQYLEYYYNPNPFPGSIGAFIHSTDGDFLVFAGLGYIEITTPKITKGRWEVSANMLTGNMEYPVFEVYIDGNKINTIDARITSVTDTGNTLFGRVNFAKSEEHKIKLVIIYPGRLFWDSVEFTPI
jgi:uncharacterized surface protein with fasciclin (FAS1) repeats